jgi:hypothetical protein
MMITIGSIMVFFRAADVVDAVAVFRGIFTGTWGWSQRFDPHLLVLGVVWSAHLVRGLRAERAPYELSAPVRGGLWAMMLMLLLYGTVETGDQFIYFQF